MKEQSIHEVSLTVLKTEVRQMMAMCFWKNSHHWSSHPSRRKRDFPQVVIRVAYFKTINWVGFNFCKYHAAAVEIFRRLPPSERFFYEIAPNCYAKFKVWCVDCKHFKYILTKLYSYADIEVEFVISPYRKGLVVPEAFALLGLTFYERGVKAEGQGSRRDGI